MSDEVQTYVHVMALGVDPAWRRRPDDERRRDADALAEAHARSGGSGVTSIPYSMVGLKAGIDLLLWRSGPSVNVLEETAAALLAAGIGRWSTLRHAMLGRVGASQYVRKPSAQEQSILDGVGLGRYLIVYPFTKSADWYLLSREARQGVMNEHMRVGHDYPTVRQALAYSFGLDDQEFIVAYDTDDLVAFGDLVRALRETESRRSTVRDTPILVGVRRPLDEILRLLGG